MSTLKHLFLLIAVLFLFIPSLASAQETGSPKTVEYTVIADAANLRSGAGTNFDVVGTLHKGDSLFVYDETPEVQGWFRVYRSGEDDAYIADFLVERAPARYYPLDQESLVTLSGQGNGVTEAVEIPEGVYRVDAVAEARTFEVNAVTIDGDCDDQRIFFEYYLYSHQTTISGFYVASGDCKVMFEVNNPTGTWEFALRDIQNPEAMETMLSPIEDGSKLSGKAHSLTMPTMLPEGAWTISVKASGSYLILQSHVLDGDCQDELIFDVFDSTLSTIEQTAVYRSAPGGCLIVWEASLIELGWEFTFEQVG